MFDKTADIVTKQRKELHELNGDDLRIPQKFFTTAELHAMLEQFDQGMESIFSTVTAVVRDMGDLQDSVDTLQEEGLSTPVPFISLSQEATNPTVAEYNHLLRMMQAVSLMESSTTVGHSIKTVNEISVTLEGEGGMVWETVAVQFSTDTSAGASWTHGEGMAVLNVALVEGTSYDATSLSTLLAAAPYPGNGMMIEASFTGSLTGAQLSGNTFYFSKVTG